MTTTRLPSPCPFCGAYSLAAHEHDVMLLAVCDVLVLKALEAMGKWIVRADRSRFKALGERPFHVAHTLWTTSDLTVDKALRGAWDVVPAMLATHGYCDLRAEDVSKVLDDYVHDLVVSGTAHTLDELAYRFRTRLSMPVGGDVEAVSV